MHRPKKYPLIRGLLYALQGGDWMLLIGGKGYVLGSDGTGLPLLDAAARERIGKELEGK